ncbi:hypothetical protein VTK73DRAFT_72 [Phialemonium thermophilum]|uniref:Protein kinase domain-containing protein n=1 Tax=Phialemonium thermophilum TaxID=223376 RepID=A0ABR3Y7U3_9PEZI
MNNGNSTTNTMWWDDETIEKTVTRNFVCSHLSPDQVKKLDRPLGFGDGLTDGTYWEWIAGKAKRVFLILLDLGLADRIFSVIDGSWDDEDLPIALEQVERLALTASKDPRLERSFYYRQYHYLLKMIRKGEHVLYNDMDVIPINIVDRKATLSHSISVDKVTLPNEPNIIFYRRRIPLSPGSPGTAPESAHYVSYEEFLYQVNSVRDLQNEHLLSYWASYVHQDYGYVLFAPVSEFSLKSLLTTTPPSVKVLDKPARRRLIFDWIHCLLDTLCFIHSRGLFHGNIKPSTILFTQDNRVFYSDFTQLNAELLASTADRATFNKEAYDYAAPEQRSRSNSASSSSPTHRKPSVISPLTSASPPEEATFSISRGRNNPGAGYEPSIYAPSTRRTSTLPYFNPQAADIFSLGCVILELLTYLMKKPTRAFASHRAAKNKMPGRGGAVPDSSFQKNLGQVESWMGQLAKEATSKSRKKMNILTTTSSKKKQKAKADDQEEDDDDDAGGRDRAFRAVTPALHIVERMLSLHPSDRPTAFEVQARMYEVLREGGVEEPHCVHNYSSHRAARGWNLGPSSNRNPETWSFVTGASGSSRSRSTGSLVGGYDHGTGFTDEGHDEEKSGVVGLGSGFQTIRDLRVKTTPAVYVGH